MKSYFPVNRWKLVPTIAGVTFSHDTKAAAEKAGREQAARWKDQTFERVFHGTRDEFEALRKEAEDAVAPKRRRRRK
jgi:hypothetical protein